MQPNDFTFSMLAAAIAAAGGRVVVTRREILRRNSEELVDITPAPDGGIILTLARRPDTQCLDTTLLRAHQDEAR